MGWQNSSPRIVVIVFTNLALSEITGNLGFLATSRNCDHLSAAGMCWGSGDYLWAQV